MKIDVQLTTQQIKQIASYIDLKDIQEYINNNKADYEKFLQNEQQSNIDNTCDNSEWIQKGNKLICNVQLDTNKKIGGI